MTYYVYSTATCSGTYICYEDNPKADIAVPKRWPNGEPMKVTIQGGHGVANKHFVTPKGVVTAVTDQEFEMLQQNPDFKRHVDAGFLSYDKKKVDPEKKAANMAPKDGSAPLTPKDFEESANSSSENKIYKKKA